VYYIIGLETYSKISLSADECFKEEFNHVKYKLLKMSKIEVKKVRVSEQSDPDCEECGCEVSNVSMALVAVLKISFLLPKISCSEYCKYFQRIQNREYKIHSVVNACKTI
jgi:hypothetical protein